MEKEKIIAAFFDIDGTIHRSSLLTEHFKTAVKYEYIDMLSWEKNVKEKFNKWEKRAGNYDEYLDELVAAYVEGLKNMRKEDVDFIASRVIELKGERVYRYSRDRLKFHKEQGHKIIFISGSPEFLVSKMAEKYGAEDYRGAIYELNEDGVFTGKVTKMYDKTSKQKAINEFVEKYNIDLSKSYAYGDTTGDLTMFKAVGNPVAINPAKTLMDTIKADEQIREKIEIIVERKDVIYKLDHTVEIL